MVHDSLRVRRRKSRLAAAVFLLAGILIGVLSVPSIPNRALTVLGRNERIPKLIPLRFGLDIQGGAHLVYRADVTGISNVDPAASLSALRDVIERRVNLFGIAEPRVQSEREGSEYRLIVELAGVEDVGEAIRMIGETPYLEFRTERTPDETQEILKRIASGGERQEEDPRYQATALTGRFIERAEIIRDPTTYVPAVSLRLNAEGAALFEELTGANIGKTIAIYLDGAPISAPVVQEKISGGRAQISGNFTEVEAREFAGRLNAGALPVPIELIAQERVGASLGRESLDLNLMAGLIGFAALAAFMLFWYRLPGLAAVAALMWYLVAAIFAFELFSVTLTLAGVVGFILSIGMAVDANVLIFERMKEELLVGKAVHEAVEEGFRRAWTSIRDSNVSSLITSGILYWFGTSTVRGFALTLAMGILISMLTAITFTRTLLRAVVPLKEAGIRRWIFLSGWTRPSLPGSQQSDMSHTGLA